MNVTATMAMTAPVCLKGPCTQLQIALLHQISICAATYLILLTRLVSLKTR